MTRFVHLEYSNQHPGVARVESAMAVAHKLQRGFSGTRGLAAMLLSAIAAAVLVVAYQVMGSVAEGHLLVIWIAMWALAFALLALSAGATRQLAVRLKAGLDGWSRSLAESRADQRLWTLAQTDPRVMTDLQAAMMRDEEIPDATRVQRVTPSRNKVAGGGLLRAYQRNYI